MSSNLGSKCLLAQSALHRVTNDLSLKSRRIRCIVIMSDISAVFDKLTAPFV